MPQYLPLRVAMIIDFHRHLWSAPERYPSVRESGVDLPIHTPVNGVEPGTPTADLKRGTDIIKEMNEVGVDLTVLLLGDYGLLLGEGPLSVAEENERLSELVSHHPGRLTFFLGVDPRRPEAVELFRQGLENWGARGLKLHPGSGFSPDDPTCFPLFELAGEWDVPVAVHTGPIASPLRSVGAQPIRLDEVAARFPRTKIVMLHAGQDCWWREALQIAMWKPNIYLELAGWQVSYRQDPLEFARIVATMVAVIGSERILFGGDNPAMAGVMPLGEWISVFRNLTDHSQRLSPPLSSSDISNMLGQNAARLLGLDVSDT